MSQIFLSPFAMPELDRVVEQLCAPSSLEGVFHRPLHDAPMPSLDVLGEILSRLKIALFPGYFGMSNVRMESMRYPSFRQPRFHFPQAGGADPLRRVLCVRGIRAGVP